MADINGNGKVSNQWMLNVVVGVLVTGAGAILGWQMKSAMPRAEVEVMKKQADEIHARHEAELVLLHAVVFKINEDIAVLKFQVGDMYGERKHAKR